MRGKIGKITNNMHQNLRDKVKYPSPPPLPPGKFFWIRACIALISDIPAFK